MIDDFQITEEAFNRPNKLGVVKVKKCYLNGQLNCGPSGSPAVEEFNAEEKVVRVWRYASGKLTNGPNGEPAIEKFDQVGRPTYQAYSQDNYPKP